MYCFISKNCDIFAFLKNILNKYYKKAYRIDITTHLYV